MLCRPAQLCEALTQVPKTVAYPLRLSLDKAKGKFKFLPPSAIKIAGSYLLQTLVKPDLNVDVVMVMPEVGGLCVDVVMPEVGGLCVDV